MPRASLRCSTARVAQCRADGRRSAARRSARGASAAAAMSDEARRSRVRLAQVMTGPRASCCAGRRRPHAQMIFGDRNRAIRQRLERAGAVEPGRRDEARDRPADDVLDQRAAVGDSRFACVRSGQAEEFAFAGGHAAARASGRAARRMPHLVAMKEAVEEHLDARVGPARAAARRRASPGRSAHRPNDWARPASRGGRRRAAASRSISRSTSLSKRGRHVVDRGEEQSVRRHSRRIYSCVPDRRVAGR